MEFLKNFTKHLGFILAVLLAAGLVMGLGTFLIINVGVWAFFLFMVTLYAAFMAATDTWA